MPALLGPAIDPTPVGPAEVYVSAGSTITAPFPPAPPVDGDPDATYVAPRFGPQVQVLLGHAITREVYGELTTADVESWDRDVELLAGATAEITALSTDPLWAAVGLTWSMGADGRKKYHVAPERLVVWVVEDMATVWTGMFRNPIDIGGGKVALPAQGPQAVFAERILGKAEQDDLLRDRGSFESYANVAAMLADGWSNPDSLDVELVADGVRGAKCVRVRGDGWFLSPKVTTTGADGYGRAVIGSVFGKWADAVPEGATVIITYTQRTDSLAPWAPEVSLQNAGVRPDDSTGWTDSPVASGARMSPQVVAHRTWTALRSFPSVWSYYDLDTIRESVQTGFPPGSDRDLSLYVPKIMTDLHSRSLGGSPTGLTVRVVEPLTGVETSQRWSHAQRTPVSDVLSAVLDADGGPECRITPGWVLEVHKRLGRDRDDISLTAHDMADPGWTTDPGGRVTDFVVDTGRGSGATAITASAHTPVLDDEWRSVAIVQMPVDRSLNEAQSWARAHARAKARTQVTAEADVPYALAKQITEGDRVWCVNEDGDLADVRRMRVLRIKYQPKRLRAVISLGNAEDA